MKMNLELKSLFVGVIITVLLTLALGATKESFLRVGRFHIEVDHNHVFVLDSITGQVWEKYLLPDRGTTSKDFAEPKL